MRRGTLTIQARYVYPVEGPPIEDGCLTIEQGRIAWVGTSDERRSDLDLGNVGDRARLRQCAHPPRARAALAARPGRAAIMRTKCPGCEHVVDQRRAGTEQSLRRGRGQERQGVDRRRDDLSGRHHDGRSLLGAGRRRTAARRRLRRVDRAKRDRGLETSDIGLEVARLDPPREPGGRLRAAWPEPARALQHRGLALSQGRRQPDAALHPLGRDARRAAAC